MSCTIAIGQPASVPEVFCAAKTLQPSQRQELAIQVLAGSQPVAALARENQVSRKFLYAQAEKAQQGLAEVFAAEDNESHVLYHLPVTKEWIRQLVLGLVLIGHSSMRGVVEILRDVFDLPLSVGTVHNILCQAVANAREVHKGEELSGIEVGAHDEIFQLGQPVLVGVDTHSTYCYLLALAEGRDATTWGVHLLDLQAKGLQPRSTVADFGKGLRAGQAEAWPGVPCNGDVFHVSMDLSEVAHYFENRALGVMATVEKLASKNERAKEKTGEKLAHRLAAARLEQEQALWLAHDIALLDQWMRQDILALVGPDLQTRRTLFDWVVEELRLREGACPHRIAPIRKKLENHREEILGFVAALELALRNLAKEFEVSPAIVWEIYQLQGLAAEDPRLHQAETALWQKLGERFHYLRLAVQETLAQTVRASSIVENLNSRLRCYFFLRRELGPGYLDLLRFFLNHRRFLRSERPEREGKSPVEILTGRRHPHWLESLGYQAFKRAA